MEMLAAAGFKWIRMDFDWNQLEYERGKYRFDAYDRLIAALDKHGIRALFILDYVNQFYDSAQSPHSDEAIEAFARFAAAAAVHYRRRGILWEMYNEPNIGFWRPKPNVNDYVRLATAVGKAIRKAAPESLYVGPATSGVDLAFLEACFKAGLLEYWDAVTVHPYRQSPPETVVADYGRLRDLIRRYAPKGKKIPIISGEWGYSAVWGGMDADKQGKFLPRQWLINMACDVPLSIWYDWHDDGPDPKEPEHHFGTVLYPYRADATPVYEPKPAYLAAQTLSRHLEGFRFSKRLMVGDAQHFVLLFQRGKEVRLAAWSSHPDGTEVVIPASPGAFEAVDHLGRRLPNMTAAGPGLRIRLTDAPVYLKPLRPNPVLTMAAQWQRLPSDMPVEYRPTVRLRTAFRNTTDRRVRVSDGLTAVTLKAGARCELTTAVAIERSVTPKKARLVIRVDNAAPLIQETQITVTNPLSVELRPPSGGRLPLVVSSPTGSPFRGTVTVQFQSGNSLRSEQRPLLLSTTERRKELEVPMTERPTDTLIGFRLLDENGRVALSGRPVRFRPVMGVGSAPASDEVRLTIVPDGDARVGSEQSLSVAEPPEGAPRPGMRCYRLTYRFDPGWKFLRVVTAQGRALSIEGKPTAAAVWIWGDGSRNIPRLRFVDSTNQTFQPDGDPIDWKGWRYVVFPMDGTRSGRWGGADDGVIHYPIRWDSMFLLDSRGELSGEIYFAGLTLIYEHEEGS